MRVSSGLPHFLKKERQGVSYECTETFYQKRGRITLAGRNAYGERIPGGHGVWTYYQGQNPVE